MTLLTTVVRGVGRDNALKRWIAFHKQFGVPLVVVGDLAPDAATIGDSIKIVPAENMLPAASKILLGLKNIATPYVAWVADDDFMLGSMLEKSVALLENNKKIVACDGLNMFVDEMRGRG